MTSKKENVTMNGHRRAIVKLNKNVLKSAYRDISITEKEQNKCKTQYKVKTSPMGKVIVLQ